MMAAVIAFHDVLASASVANVKKTITEPCLRLLSLEERVRRRDVIPYQLMGAEHALGIPPQCSQITITN